jgi:steroid delta-isomerase-like uncharacterized protein
MTSAEEKARSYFAALAARDPDAMAAHWSPDGVDELTGIGILRGPAEVAAFFRTLFAAMPDFEIVVARVTANERVAAVEWRSQGNFTGGPMIGLEPTGRLVEQRGCDCVEVEDGLIVRNTAYVDGLETARSIGLLPPQDSAVEKLLYGAFNAATRLRRRLTASASR